MKLASDAVLLASLISVPAVPRSMRCVGAPITEVRGLVGGQQLTDGTIFGHGKVNINIDGFARAYHPRNADAGALIHLCNAGEVYLPDGASYHGSVSNTTCTGRFMEDVRKIGAAGWKNPQVGAVRWYGILGDDEVRMGGRLIKGVRPVAQADGSGFYVSPTSFVDSGVNDTANQARYINPLRIPSAVIPNQPILKARGISMGSFGVALNRKRGTVVPFVVGDFGPRVGEATPALARPLAGLPVTDNVTRKNRFAGQVGTPEVTWVFFGKSVPAARYDSKNEAHLLENAQQAFEAWGGTARLKECHL